MPALKPDMPPPIITIVFLSVMTLLYKDMSIKASKNVSYTAILLYLTFLLEKKIYLLKVELMAVLQGFSRVLFLYSYKN